MRLFTHRSIATRHPKPCPISFPGWGMRVFSLPSSARKGKERKQAKSIEQAHSRLTHTKESTNTLAPPSPRQLLLRQPGHGPGPSHKEASFAACAPAPDDETQHRTPPVVTSQPTSQMHQQEEAISTGNDGRGRLGRCHHRCRRRHRHYYRHYWCCSRWRTDGTCRGRHCPSPRHR